MYFCLDASSKARRLSASTRVMLGILLSKPTQRVLLSEIYDFRTKHELD